MGSPRLFQRPPLQQPDALRGSDDTSGHQTIPNPSQPSLMASFSILCISS